MKKAMTKAEKISRLLVADRYRRSLVITNWYPGDWYECDVAEITSADYLVEFEIKTSKADFKADASKRKYVRRRRTSDGVISEYHAASKHEALASGEGLPNRFYFVTPADLEVEIPAWAGLITVEFSKYSYLRIRKQAPLLHSNKLEERIKRQLYISHYHRHVSKLISGGYMDSVEGGEGI